MKKKELLAMRALNATPRMMQLVQEDPGEKKVVRYTYSKGKTVYDVYQRYQYYRAAVNNGILKVAVFSRKYLAAGAIKPEYEIYISKEENTHLTYDPVNKKWKTGKIDSLKYELDNGAMYGNKTWASDNTKRIVNEYLGTGKKEVKEAILSFQNDVGKERLRKKHKTELEQIDAVMNTVPELPKDFDSWVKESAFYQERYLIYHYGDKENTAFCTHCKKIVKLRKTPYHNKNGVCQACRTNALQKAWNKQKYLVDEKQVGIIQKLTDGSGYVIRKFRCKIKRTLEKNWDTEFAGCWETARFKLDHHFRKVEVFEWGTYKDTGIERWCHEINHGYFYGGISSECVLYHRNIKKIRKEAGMKYVPIEEVLKRNQGCYCYPDKMMRNCLEYPAVEYLIKSGLMNLAWEQIAGTYHEYTKMDWDQKKIWNAMGIKKEQMNLCIRMDITGRQLQVLKKSNKYGITLTAEQISFFTKEIGPGAIEDVLKYGHIEKFEGYLKELLEIKGNRVGDYIDYLSDIEALRLPADKDILFPRNFQETHLRISKQRQEKEDALKKMEIEEKDRVLQEMLPELSELYSMQDEQFMIVLPTCKEDFNREGRENHNCVGGVYFDKMLKGASCVMFLRHIEEPDKAFCTVEMDGSRILQCRAKLNAEAPKEAKAFMEKFSREVEKRIEKKNKERMQRLMIAV